MPIKPNSAILFLTQTIYTLFKRSPLKYKFLRFSSARVKIRQISYVNYELTSDNPSSNFVSFFIVMTQVIFPSNFASIFSSLKNNSSILFLAQTLFTLVKSSLLKCKCLRFSSARVKICQIPHVNSSTDKSLPLQILPHCSLS